MAPVRRPGRTLTAFFLFFLAVLFAAPFIGPESIGPGDLFSGGSTTRLFIFWTLRVPRLLLGLFAGAALSLAGMSFQTLFRNPLATPFTLGVSSGAAFGVSVAVLTGLSGGLMMSSFEATPLFALGGAFLVVIILYRLARSGSGLSTLHLLLAGVALSYFFSSLLLFAQYAADFTQTFRMVRWLMGNLETIGYAPALALLPALLYGVAILLINRRELDLLLCGEEIARSRGVPVDYLRKQLYFVASILTAVTVAACGPIGFVGLVVPHVLRLLLGESHGKLIAGSLLLGGPFLVACDAVARNVVGGSELPVGIVTALLGGPFFLYLLICRRRRSAGAR